MNINIRHDAIERAITEYEAAEVDYRQIHRSPVRGSRLLPITNRTLRRARQTLEEMLVARGLPYRYRGRVYHVDRGGFLTVHDENGGAA